MRNRNRREFVKNISGLALGASLMPLSCKMGGVPQRLLGRTGEKVSLLTLGGYHMAEPFVPDEESIQIIRTAIDGGVNFLDNAWAYQKGRSQKMMGLALQDGYRDKVLIMTKLMARTVEDAKVQMETSLERSGLDSLDLMQFHGIGWRPGCVEAVYEKGLIEWAEEQRSQGVFKYIGFTGHSNTETLIEMIERGFPWDTIQLPINIGDYHRAQSFEKHVLPLAIKNNIGVLGMKSNCIGELGKSGFATPVEGLRYAMSLPVSTVVSGIDSLEILEENLTLFRHFTPMDDEELAEIRTRAMGRSEEIEKYRV